MKVQDSLHFGVVNAIPAKELVCTLGFHTVRDLQKQIEHERQAGAPILADSNGGGYYLSNDPQEISRFVRTLNARARNTAKAAAYLERTIDDLTGQERLAGWYDGQS